jgi:hypothetical protein
MDDDLSALDDFDFDLVQTDQKQNKDSFFATTATENLSTPPSEFGPARRDVFAAPAPVAIAPSSSSSFSSSGFAEPFNPYKRKFGEIMPSSSSSSANDNNNGTHSDLGDVGNFPFLSPEPKRRVTSSSSASASASAATHTNNHSHSVFSLGGLSPVLARPLSPSAQLQREKEALSPVLSYRQSPNTGMPSSLDFNLADLHSTQWATGMYTHTHTIYPYVLMPYACMCVCSAKFIYVNTGIYEYHTHTVMQDDLASAVVPSACANVQDFRLAVLGEGSHGHYSRMGAVHLGKDMNLQQVCVCVCVCVCVK